MSDLALRNLFQPCLLGNIQLKNRIAMLACQTNLSTGHYITDRLKKFYEARAKGGVGLIVVGFIFLYRYPEDNNNLCMEDDSFIDEYKALTDVIHDNGVKVMAQIGIEHLWRKSPGSSLEAIGPSDVSITRHYPLVRPLPVEEIQRVEDDVVNGIVRAREAGFDGVEVHAAQGLLLSQFLSPFTNRRVDMYGIDCIENRTRILSEIFKKARKRTGPDFTLTCKISGDDFIEGGNSLEDAAAIAPQLEKIGFQGINIAAGWHNSPVPLTVSMVPEGGFAYLSERIRREVHIPVISSYRITSPHTAEDILTTGKADIIGLARALIADPEWPHKAERGLFEDIRPCIVCCRCLDQSFAGREGIFCSVNPLVGREGDPVAKTEPKKVFIIGAGPAGMQAALTTKERGHFVELTEATNSIGGQLNLAALPPYKSDILRIIKYYEHQIKKAGIKVRLNSKAIPEMLAREKPDSIIVATGTTPLTPDFPGMGLAETLRAVDVIAGKVDTGERVIIAGGGMIGCETAEILASKGKTVIVLEMLDRIACDVGPSNRWVLLMRLKKAGVRLESGARVVEVGKGKVLAQREGKLETFEGDSIIIAVGMKPENKLADDFKGLVNEVIVIGDASNPRRIKEAVEEGYLAGLML